MATWRELFNGRAAGVPVLWVQHSDDEELVYGSAEWQLVPELKPLDGEITIHKQFNSAFEQTNLEEQLTRLGVSHVALAGASTNWCIRATAYGALERGYDVTLIEDGHTTGSFEWEDGSTIEAAHIVEDLNITMAHLSYPGRTNTVAKAEQINFRKLSNVTTD